MTIQEANKALLFRLYDVYDKPEAANIADLVMENITGLKRIDRVIDRTFMMALAMEQQLVKYMDQLAAGQPVQYVLHEAWFCGMKFYVDEHVLIPRPETEELVEWVAAENRDMDVSILDVGTGSGCIAVALSKKLPRATVYACDISREALKIAASNAATNGESLEFIQADILSQADKDLLPRVDIIVSNPPYIPRKQMHTMDKNVVDHEPHLALFVSDDDPLMFYKAIAALPADMLYVEVHEDLAEETARLFQSACIKKDMQGKNRMIRGKKEIGN